MTLPIMEFMRRFLQHVLPRGFMKVRYYGFLAPGSAVPLEDIKARIELAHGFAVAALESPPEAAAPMLCRSSGGVLRFSRVVLPGDSALRALDPLAGGSSMLSLVSAGP